MVSDSSLRNQSIDSNAKGLKVVVVAAVAGIAMAASAAAGAWVQSHFGQRPVLSNGQERIIAEQTSIDSVYIRENVSLLASKVGQLQAELIAMGGLSKRVADAAGVSFTDPEVHAGLLEANTTAVMDDIGDDAAASWSAEGLGRQLDALSRQVSEQKDWFGMLDLVLTRRTGIEASLPTFMPVDYPYLSSSFGWRRNPVTGRHSMHEGLDFAAPRGTPIHAASGGVITEARFVPGYGKLVEINHGNGMITRYAHASSINVKMGDLVEKGQVVARVGSTGRSTGAHLHFEVRMAGHPLDPTLFLDKPNSDSHFVADASGVADANLTQVR
jgi:murein DD-endopeptidase MepM/ murein hydrolase activator NlpD